jgi:hypothetical protein
MVEVLSLWRGLQGFYCLAVPARDADGTYITEEISFVDIATETFIGDVENWG